MCRHNGPDEESTYLKAREERKGIGTTIWVVCPKEFQVLAEKGMFDALMDWALNEPPFDGLCYVKQTKDLWILSPDPGCELDV